MSRGRHPNGQTRRAVAELHAQGLSGAAIARQLDISKPTVCFHLRMLGVSPAADFAQRYDWQAIRNHYESGHSMTECMAAFGFSRNAWWDAIRRGVIMPHPRSEPIHKLLIAGRRRCRSHVKLRLLEAGLKEPRCESCGLTDWHGMPLALELHHVNGDGLDNRLQNLQLRVPKLSQPD